jgi:hypothetical protein
MVRRRRIRTGAAAETEVDDEPDDAVLLKRQILDRILGRKMDPFWGMARMVTRFPCEFLADMRSQLLGSLVDSRYTRTIQPLSAGEAG